MRSLKNKQGSDQCQGMISCTNIQSSFTAWKPDPFCGHCFFCNFRNPQPVQLVKKVLAVHLQFVPQYAPPICNALPCWLLNLGERESRSAPPICTAVHLLFVPQYASHLYRRYFWEIPVVGPSGKFLILGRTMIRYTHTHTHCYFLAMYRDQVDVQALAHL